MILFPDGVTIKADEATSWGAINNGSAWVTNCTSAQWTALATKGCVFLPAAGYREGTQVYLKTLGENVEIGRYWSTTNYGESYAYDLHFYGGEVNPQNNHNRHYGHSVRLVRDAN